MDESPVMMTTEHILLESDDREVPEPRSARKVHASLRLRSGLRRRSVELDIIDYYFLAVRTRRTGAPAAEYVLDLRIVDPDPRLSKHVAWRWMSVTLVLAALFAGSVGWIATSPVWWQHEWLRVSAFLFAAAGCAGLVSVYRTTETLSLYSAHGEARLLEVVGGLGTFRAVKRFTVKLAAHVQIAIAARRPARAAHLRDEMREHFRLKELGVISAEAYDASKARILAQHVPGSPNDR